MASHLPSAQAKKGDQDLHLARNLRDEWKDVIPEEDINAIQNRITMCVVISIGCVQGSSSLLGQPK